MKAWLNIKIKHLGIGLGWYSGEEFYLFNLEIMRVWQENSGLTIIGVQIFKFCFEITIS